MDEQEKLHNLVEALQLTPYQFSKSLGYDRPEAIYKVLNGKTVNPGISLYVKIKQTFPQVRYEYLLDGQGPILNDPATKSSGEEVEELRRQNVGLREDVKLLRDTLRSMNSQILGKFKVALKGPEQSKRSRMIEYHNTMNRLRGTRSGVRP